MRKINRVMIFFSAVVMALLVLMGSSSVYAATSATSTQKLAVPENIRKTYEGGKIVIRWDAVPGADGYWVYIYENYDKNKEFKKSVKVTKINVSNANVEKDYSFHICAFAGSGDSAVFSDWVDFNITSAQLKDVVKRAEELKKQANKEATKLATPKVSYYFDGATAVMSWDKVPGASEYIVGLYQGSRDENGKWSYNGTDPKQTFKTTDTRMNLSSFNGTEEYVLGVKAVSKDSVSDEYAFVGLVNDYFTMSIEDSVALSYDQLLMFLTWKGYTYRTLTDSQGHPVVSVTLENKNVPKSKFKRIGKSFVSNMEDRIANADAWEIAGDVAKGALEKRYDGESWGDSIKGSAKDTATSKAKKSIFGSLVDAYMESTTDPNMYLDYYFDPNAPDSAAIEMQRSYLTMHYPSFESSVFADSNLTKIDSGRFMYVTESKRPVIISMGNSGAGETVFVYYAVTPESVMPYIK